MNIRPFDWRDIPTLHRHRNHCVFLNSSLLLTRGALFFPGAMLSAVTDAAGIATATLVDGGKDRTLIGQTLLTPGSNFAKLTFLTPEQLLMSPALPYLLEYLALQTGERGAFRLLADVEENGTPFEALRGQGFAIYTRQRVWKIDNLPNDRMVPSWKPAVEQDLIGVNSLFHNVVPGLVQQVESIHSDRLHGMVYRHEGDLLAYVELKYGHKGIWLQPLIHPDLEHLDLLITSLLQNLPNRFARPVYLCIRSYLSWLEPILEELGAKAGSRQAVMVKHLAIAKKALRPVAIPALEGGRPEISAPIAHSEKHS